ncbi:hypothetical protein R3P38DRAFT_3016923 [Favolaschia claudopus]|uniref:Uncharacterized protein n=1 Tax=Favolaschia claudopus TaxID=2862362 RepID=A0AAW0AJU5_9AGAR
MAPLFLSSIRLLHLFCFIQTQTQTFHFTQYKTLVYFKETTKQRRVYPISASAVKQVAETSGAGGAVTDLKRVSFFLIRCDRKPYHTKRSRRNEQDGANGAEVRRRILGVRDAGVGGQRGGGTRQYKGLAMAASVELPEKIRRRHFDAACVRVGEIDVLGMRGGRGFGRRRR